MEASPAQPHLTLVDTRTGEVVEPSGCEGCQERDIQLEMAGRELNGYRLRLAAKEKELARVQGVEPDAEKVRDVLGYWARRMVEEGWWNRTPTFRPGDQRWSAVRGRLKDGRTVEDCYRVVEGALLSDRRRTKREWMDATSLFRNNENFERHLERSLDPQQEAVRQALALPLVLRHRFVEVAEQADLCACGHIRFDHHKPDPARDGQAGCGVHGCWCDDFDDLPVRAERWLREQRERLRR